LSTVAAVAAACALTSCTSAGDERPPHPTPTAAAACNDLPEHRDDGFVLAGTDWSSQSHAYAGEATVYACVPPQPGGTVRLRAEGTGIQVSPAVAPVDPEGTGVIPFRVRVSPGTSGRLSMAWRFDGGGAGAPGPSVVSSRSTWHFEAAR
jgi:hypothetical protein